mmetsp:Transcript_55132/g.120894  ORF Transcript_55132/g.120894 Transcript_55132/m.120894 type:complete len:457 (+) Transcript_55132:1-1371(+)
MKFTVIFASVTAAKNLNVDSQLSVPATPVEELKAAYTAVETEVKRAGKITPGVYKTIIDLRKIVSEHIENAIKDAHLTDQAEVNRLQNAIVTHDTNLRTAQVLDVSSDRAQIAAQNTTWRKRWDTAVTKNEEYVECTTTRKKHIGGQVAPCCAMEWKCPTGSGTRQCKYHKLLQGYVHCDFEQSSAAACWLSAKSLVSSYESALAQEVADYQSHKRSCEGATKRADESITECESLYTTAKAAVATANAAGVTLQSSIDAFQTEEEEDCKTYATQRAKLVKDYRAVVGPCEGGSYSADYTTGYDSTNLCIMEQEKHRWIEWNATQQILCALTHLSEGGTFADDLVEKCKDEIKICHLRIKYPEIPDPEPCEVDTCVPRVTEVALVDYAAYTEFNHTKCFYPAGCAPNHEIMCVHKTDEVNGCKQWHVDSCEEITPAPQDACEIPTYNSAKVPTIICS